MSNTKKLYRSKDNRIIFGVCGGLGEYFEVDALIVRILFVILSLINGAGIVAYLILAIVVPEDNKDKKAKKNGVEEVQEKTQDLAEELKTNSWLKNSKNIFGLVIVLIGLNVLFEQVFQYSPFAWINWGIVWGLLIILIGSRIILGSSKK